jgi:hypothetical protein
MEVGMARIRKPDHIRFVAEYEDGSTHHFNIPTYTIQKTDSVDRIIASERQAKGELPKGKIKDMRRALPGGKFP